MSKNSLQYNWHTINYKYLNYKVWCMDLWRYLWNHHYNQGNEHIYHHWKFSCTYAISPSSHTWTLAVDKFKATPDVSFWNQRPCNMFFSPSDGRSKRGQAKSCKFIETSSSSMTTINNIALAKSSHMAKPNIKVLGNCTLPTLVGCLA